MVHETIRVLARAGIPQQRIHYDDALLAEDKRASVLRPRDESGETGETGNPGVQDAGRSFRCPQRPGRRARHGAPVSHAGSGSRRRAERAAGYAAGLTRGGISPCAPRRPCDINC